MDGDRRAPAPAAAASASAVLGSDDLLREILLRLGFPHYLVRAALVSKRWLLHASDPAFLRSFRDLHPPRLLGFCAGYPHSTYKFVPLPQPPELAALSRRAASSCNDAFAARRGQWIKQCRNGHLLMECGSNGSFEYSLLTPLLSGEHVAVLPQSPLIWMIFLPEDGGCDGITKVRLSGTGREVRAKVNVLTSGGWGVQTTAVIEIEPPYPALRVQKVLPPVHGKIFLVTDFGYTLGLDLMTPHFFILDLPNGVRSNFMLSCAANSGLYLVNAKEFQISVWLHQMTGDGDGAGGWLLVSAFCIREACARLDSWVPKDGGGVKVVAVGDNAEFVFLEHAASGAIFYVRLRSKVVQRYVASRGIDIFPIMMIWPPIFPARNVGHDQLE
uniref:Uncharacterized protein n=1 Tax=Avena sativa TaxID=4498 RepID=A0ACD5WP12_AVESA